MTPLQAIQYGISPYFYAGLKKKYDPPEILAANDVLRVVSKYMGVTIEQIKSKSRKRKFVLSRQICMSYLRINTNMTLKDIGLIFCQDHTSVIYATDIIKNDLEYSTEIGDLYRKIFNL